MADNLTRYNSAVMFAARELKREGRINSSWTDSGKMKVKIGGRDSPTKIIRSAADLRKLVGDHVALDAADALLRSQQIAGRDRPLDGTPGAARAPERGITETGTDRPSGSGAVADQEDDTSDSDCETPSPANQQGNTAANVQSNDGRSTRNRPSRRPVPDTAPASTVTPVTHTPAGGASQSRRGRSGGGSSERGERGGGRGRGKK